MAIDLKVSVRKEITQLKRNVAQKTSALRSLKDELKRHDRVHKLLSGERPRARRVRRAERVDWNSVLRGLPRHFTVSSIAQKRALNTRSRIYFRQVLLRDR